MQAKRIYQLTGKELRSAAMPLGGIGSGSIAIGGDGLLKQWQINNTVKHNAFIPNSFFGVWIKKLGETNEKPTCRALICPKVHDDPNFEPAEMVSDHKIGLAAKDMFEILPGVEEIRFNGEYPAAFLEFLDQSIPIDISLITFNPFIPLDPKNSGLPLIVFQFHITNTSNSLYEVVLEGNLLNFLGWDGIKVFKGTESILFGGNLNNSKKIGNWHAIQMRSKTLLKTDRRYGDLTFAIDQPDAIVTSQWSDLANFWSHFSEHGEFPKSNSEEMSPIGQTWVGSLGSRKVIHPGETIQIRFLMTWNFPNRVVDWVINKTQIPDQNTEFWIGNRYSEWFNNSAEVINYFQQNSAYLMNKTEQFHEIFFSSTLPPEVITSISATISTIRSPSCFWMRDGSFHGFEGCHGECTGLLSGGCCPLDCTHVWNYEFSLAQLYPSLERTMRETEFKMQHESGYLPHRAVIPLYLPQLLKDGKSITTSPAIDGMFGAILKIYRDFLITSDLDFLKRAWAFVDKLINYIFENHDKELTGVIYSEQSNTYDCILYGINSFIGSLYLTALLACEQIVRYLNIPDLPDKFRNIYNSGKRILDQECWNGEYYIQKYDKEKIKKHQYGIGCHSDQLLGQWWAFQLGFGYILPPDHVNKAIDSIVKYNFKETLQGIQQFRMFASSTDSGLLNCTWPHGEQPAEPTLYTNEVWTGIEYEVAALCVFIGKNSEALKIIRSIRNRYDGTRRNPWNEIECGDHYVRAMASWSLLHALTGVIYSRELKQFKISPRINAENFKTFFITGTAWGEVNQQVSNKIYSCSLSISHGDLEVRSVHLVKLGGYTPTKCSVFLKKTIEGERKAVGVKFSTYNSKIDITFTDSILLQENHQLFIELN